MNSSTASIALPILAGVAVGVATGGSGAGLSAALMAGGLAGSATAAGVGAVQQAQSASQAAAQAKTQAEAQKAAGAQRAAEIKRQLAATLGTQQAILASRGISDYTAGSTAAAVGSDSINSANRDLTTNRFNMIQQIGQSLFQRQQYGLQKTAAVVSGLGSIADTGMRYADWKSRIGGPGTGTGSTPVLGYTAGPRGPGGTLGHI